MTKRIVLVALCVALAIPTIRPLRADDDMLANCSHLDKWDKAKSYSSGTKVKYENVAYKCTSSVSAKPGELTKEPPNDSSHWTKIAKCCGS
jgi:hypothetical protein